MVSVTDERLSRNTPRVTYFDKWHSDLDAALKELPEIPNCPADLLRALAEQHGEQTKRIALIEEKSSPLALAVLRTTDHFSWSPVTQYIIPGLVIPVQPGRLIEAFLSLDVTLNIALWRMNEPLPNERRIRDLRRIATHGMDLTTDDFEAYWKKSRLFRNIRNARNRCKKLTMTINEPGALHWIITNWGKKWGIASDEVKDRIAVAEYFEERQKYYSFMLLEEGRRIGGISNFIDGREVVCHHIYSENGYEYYNPGTSLFDITFRWAKDAGYCGIDMGGGFDYKSRFAPERGKKVEFTVRASIGKFYAGKFINKIRPLILSK